MLQYRFLFYRPVPSVVAEIVGPLTTQLTHADFFSLCLYFLRHELSDGRVRDSHPPWQTGNRIPLHLSLFSAPPQTNHPGRLSGLGSSSLAPRDRRGARAVGAALEGDLSNQHLPHNYLPLHGRPPASERHTAREERRCQGQSAAHSPAPTVVPLSSTTLPPRLSSSSSSSSSFSSSSSSATTSAQPQVSGAANPTTVPCLSSRQPQGVSSSSESLTQGGGGGGGGVSLSGGPRRAGEEHHPPSLIPRAVGASSSSSLHSLASRGSPSQSVSSSAQASPPPPPTPSSASFSSSSSSTFTGRLGQPPRGPLSLHSYSRKNVFLQHSLHTSELLALTQRDS